MKVGVISDTHGVLREHVVQQLETCDVIIHGGDIGKCEILERLGQIAQVYVVRGNNDKESWGQELPEVLKFDLEGVTIALIHDVKMLKGSELPEQVELVICGHSHKYRDEVQEGVRYLNPGSCGRRRFGLPLTMAIMTIGEGEVIQINQIEVIES